MSESAISSVENRAGKVRGSFKRRITALAAVAAFAAPIMGGMGAAQAVCPSDVGSGTVAKSVRTLQSDMMVAALSCQERSLYNAFAVQYRQQLVRHGKALKLHFKNTFGGAHSRKLNAFVTELANDASIRHARTGSAYCVAAREVFSDLLEGETQKDLDVYGLQYAIGVRPSLAQEIVTAAGSSTGCDDAVALNLPE